MAKSRIKLALTGMDPRSQTLFRKSMELHMQGICECVEVKEADVVVIDMDSENSGEYWNSLKDNYPNLPVIALSIRLINEKNTIYLRKPIKIPTLISTLRILFPKCFLKTDSVNSDLKSQEIKSTAEFLSTTNVADAINKNAHQANNVTAFSNRLENSEYNSVVFEPSNHLIAYVKKAVTESNILNKYVKITLWNNKIIIVTPKSEQIITNISEGVLRSLAIVTVNEEERKLSVDHVGPEILNSFNPNADAALKSHRTETFIWLLALLTARGRIPIQLNDNDFDLENPVFIRHWPNLTRLEPVPHAQQITSILVNQPRSIAEVAEVLNIDIKHVINLFFAAAALGYADQARRPSDNLVLPVEPQKSQNPQNRKIFSAILSKLRGLVDTNNGQTAS